MILSSSLTVDTDDFVVEHLTGSTENRTFFAVNEKYRLKQRKVRKIGAYTFLAFVLPIVKHAAGIIGAKWLCIYSLPEAKLMRYYESLGFRSLAPGEEAFVYSHVKPEYDSGCIFMYQCIEKLSVPI